MDDRSRVGPESNSDQLATLALTMRTDTRSTGTTSLKSDENIWQNGSGVPMYRCACTCAYAELSQQTSVQKEGMPNTVLLHGAKNRARCEQLSSLILRERLC